jgi:hypothetical protein
LPHFGLLFLLVTGRSLRTCPFRLKHRARVDIESRDAQTTDHPRFCVATLWSKEKSRHPSGMTTVLLAVTASRKVVRLLSCKNFDGGVVISLRRYIVDLVVLLCLSVLRRRMTGGVKGRNTCSELVEVFVFMPRVRGCMCLFSLCVVFLFRRTRGH